ncbi:MAG: NAD(P)/FAD-dependent oxidoreductase [Candidatus Saganbacteria bacterium]|nr:NAD(P)/FAD-dependent oxidoreductase [Candidatus Saganbacteria bacterium]
MANSGQKNFDVLIIGGGVSGTAIARELSRYRLKVGLLEKEIELAFGVSKSNSGIIHPGTQNPPNSLKGKLCVQGNELTRKISKEIGVHFEEVGELIVIFKPEDFPQLEKIKSDAEKLGVPGLKIVDRAWLDQHEPNLSKDVHAALYAPTAGIISPYRWAYDLAENAVKNGVEIFLGHKVVGIKRSSGNLRLNVAVSNSEEPRGSLAGSERTFQANHVINAAGLFADEIAKMAGVTDVEIKPRKGEEFLLDKKREHIVNHIIFPLPNPKSKGILVIKTSDGNPMIGPTAEDIADKHDLSTSAAGLNKVLESVKKMVPTISENDIIAYFAGLRPTAGKDYIIRHEDKVPGMITVAGIQSPGLTAAPAIALMVADLLKKNGLKLRKKWFFKKQRQPTVHLFAIPWQKTKELIARDRSYGDIVCRCEMVSAKEVRDAIKRGARTLDGIKFRTRAQAGRCHGGFCTTRIMKILAEELGVPLTKLTKRGPGSEIVKDERA